MAKAHKYDGVWESQAATLTLRWSDQRRMYHVSGNDVGGQGYNGWMKAQHCMIVLQGFVRKSDGVAVVYSKGDRW